jgi:hypothetical protein
MGLERSRTLQLRRPRGGRPGISVTFNIVWKLVGAARGMIARFDAIEQLAADSPGGAADQSSRPTGTGEWGPAMRLDIPHCSVNGWLCAR